MIDIYGNQIGWICPKCGRCYSPITVMCWYCGMPVGPVLLPPGRNPIEPNTGDPLPPNPTSICKEG